LVYVVVLEPATPFVATYNLPYSIEFVYNINPCPASAFLRVKLLYKVAPLESLWIVNPVPFEPCSSIVKSPTAPTVLPAAPRRPTNQPPSTAPLVLSAAPPKWTLAQPFEA